MKWFKCIRNTIEYPVLDAVKRYIKKQVNLVKSKNSFKHKNKLNQFMISV